MIISIQFRFLIKNLKLKKNYVKLNYFNDKAKMGVTKLQTRYLKKY